MLLNHCDVGHGARLAPVRAPRLEALPTIERSPAQVIEEVKALFREGGCIFRRETNEQTASECRHFVLTNKPRNLRVTIVYLADSSQSRH
jgi:hypothetical protein